MAISTVSSKRICSLRQAERFKKGATPMRAQTTISLFFIGRFDRRDVWRMFEQQQRRQRERLVREFRGRRSRRRSTLRSGATLIRRARQLHLALQHRVQRRHQRARQRNHRRVSRHVRSRARKKSGMHERSSRMRGPRRNARDRRRLRIGRSMLEHALRDHRVEQRRRRHHLIGQLRKCAPTVADGAACKAGDTCVAGDSCVNAICAKETTSTGGTGPAGSACQQDSDCATPNHCDFTHGSCAAPATTGSACFTSADCVTGLICTTGDQCEPPVASGGQCGGGDCATGLGCDATTRKCTAITFAAQGAPCDRDAVLCDRGSCNIGSSGGSQKGVCPKIIADGAACNGSDTTSACDDFADCINGTCQVPNEADCK